MASGGALLLFTWAEFRVPLLAALSELTRNNFKFFKSRGCIHTNTCPRVEPTSHSLLLQHVKNFYTRWCAQCTHSCSDHTMSNIVIG